MIHIPLHHTEYADEINLFEPYQLNTSASSTDKEQYVDFILTELNEVNGTSYLEKRRSLHARLNMLAPNTLSKEAIEALNQLLQLELNEKEITDINLYNTSKSQNIGNTKVLIWQGDITTLKVDAIVNAANNQMLGCFQPLHACIDNAIHSAAGVQLRDDCNTIMEKQGFAEPTGVAKITRAYNLPSKFVLHTVGPIVQGNVTEQSKSDLASAYISCLEICKEIDSIRSIAFCGISTGVFGYPAENAAQVALATVKQWLMDNPDCLETVVFNVFADKDKMIYESLI
ncbi:protein-ADP-ribose hydrolase [Labilibacter marinus]|uniref:protein-ADP-ribose hydrolase n=1 Tax=Labilibacter marinus TaxID=1477105 RepID=UPI0009FB6B5C|nr:protein-ADP-ribose hydrolase [Labilibacter marinus]